ncbi:uncharacterized protein LOC124928977 [Impatiens glandulifera]|uniref:uncharacterized protein LOC124928977 n=1 Tax=Impatiens glandulifera TaxID=253017 RepID=UPI001FB0A561|nr:uncharacterized protein LOC124928977 [Impatiens glandulifera]
MADNLTDMKAILEKVGVKFERNPSEARLLELGVSSWPIYEAEAGEKIPVCFEMNEIMYFLEGKVTITCEGLDGSFEIVAGNLIEFLKGMNITWHVTEAVKKRYHNE